MSGSRLLPSRILAAALGAALTAGCALPPAEVNRDPAWPYAMIGATRDVPPDLYGAPLFQGRWMAALPSGDRTLIETTEPRYLLEIGFDAGGGRTFLDFGPGSGTQNVVWARREDRLFAVASISSPHVAERPVVARALLEIDPRSWLLTASTPLSRDAVCRGLALEPHLARAFLYEDDGAGQAILRCVDLYQGRVTRERTVGRVPAGVDRKGLALDREGRLLYCVTGGDGSRGDFDPVDARPEAPAVVTFAADSLRAIGEVGLPAGFEPRALVFDEEREVLLALTTTYERSAVVLVDPGFQRVRTVVELPEPTTDLVLVDGFAFAPGAHGIYIIDTTAETWISRPGIGFEQTGEMAVSGDLKLALVRFSAQVDASAAGIAVVDLSTGAVREIWN